MATDTVSGKMPTLWERFLVFKRKVFLTYKHSNRHGGSNKTTIVQSNLA